MPSHRRDFLDIFEISDLWPPSKLVEDASATKSILFSDTKLQDFDTNLSHFPPSGLDHQALESLDSSLSLSNIIPRQVQTAVLPNTTESTPCAEAEEVDLWVLPDNDQLRTPTLHTWNGFNNPKIDAGITPYLTETGSGVFDAAIDAPEDYLGIANDDCLVVSFKVFFSSLLALGFGRSSVLFVWNEETNAFTQAISRLRIPGYTANALMGVMSIFLECGMITKFLQKYIDKSYSCETSPCQIALADSVSILLRTIQLRLGESASKEMSLIKLQTLFKPAHSILICFQHLVRNTAANRSDESLLSTVFEEIQILEHTTDTLREILLEILVRTSQPWLEFASEWLGLKRETGLPISRDSKGKSLVRLASNEWINDRGIENVESDYLLDFDKIPSFIGANDARAIFEVGKSLRFLRAHHPDHPLARTEVLASSNPPPLNWNFSWQDIVHVEARALQYEEDLKNALRNFSRNPLYSMTPVNDLNSETDSIQLGIYGISTADLETHILASIDKFDQPLQDTTSKDNLSMCLNAHLNSKSEFGKHENSSFAPPLSLTPALSFNPIISAQARIVNGCCMKLLFRCHDLRKHLSLQKEFHLFGNGVFISRLSHALFDPDLESAERRSGVAFTGGVMGLRLDGRDNWPPASSELRLILTGVLTESYSDNQQHIRSRNAGYSAQKSLPGELSFAVRDMSQKEIDECIDPGGMKALDFLRLSYKPPTPLTPVINSLILYKYDQIFKFLLRLIRMLHVNTSLFRYSAVRNFPKDEKSHTSQRFRIEAHHFISSVSGYFFDTGVNATWRIFESKLDLIEKNLNKDDDINLGVNESLDKLRDYHEQVLDRIMFVLLLRKRQQPILHLLEDIFELILKFSKMVQDESKGAQKINLDERIKATYLNFRRKVAVFITVLRGLNEKKGYGGKKSLADRYELGAGILAGTDLVEENTVVQLLTRLETSEYYETRQDVQ